MKIEKVNENQIRCTLTREDLLSRELKISELAYGTEKAKTLFRDMMRQANFEFGFEAEDIPLMIEAIPLNSECIVLIITKVEDPEELDTRFARFAPSVTEDNDDEASFPANEVLDLFHKIQSDSAETVSSAASQGEENAGAAKPVSRIFRFSALTRVMSVCSLILPCFSGRSSLYKSKNDEEYFLLLTDEPEHQESFDKVSNTVSEYGSLVKNMTAGTGYLEEHCEVLIRGNAVDSLGNA